jgi:ubiquinone/menaquinone biosynthesis C-methylase UbiE
MTPTGSDDPTYLDFRSRKPIPTPQQQAELSRYLQRISTSPVIQEVAARSIKLMALLPGQSTLDVGCGIGVFLPLLAKEVGPHGRVVGIDCSAAMVTDAEANVKAASLSHMVHVHTADACNLPFPDGSFDSAHCERVLMHIEDPNIALREMARVVRPGGRIVVAEPNWAGIQIDHPDRAEFYELYYRSLAMRHPDMGMTIYRRMGEIGLTEVTPQPVLSVSTDPGTLRGIGLDLSLGADALVKEGKLKRSRADALVAKLDELHAVGQYLSVGVYHVVSGRVPLSPSKDGPASDPA